MYLKSLLLLSFLITPLTAYSESAFPFKTTTASNDLTPQFHTLDGIVEAVNKATISAQVSGRVIEVNFDIDDFVKKGSVILRIRDKEYRARLTSAKASLKESQANHKDAQLEFNRIKGLYQDKIVSASNFDKIKAALKAAEARVAASEAGITEASEQLSHTIIKAPFSGIVIERHIEPGETMRIGQPIMTGFSMNNLRVSVDVPQTYIKAVRAHKKATIIYLENNTTSQTQEKSQSLTATKVTIFPFANPKSHTFSVRAALPKNTKNLFPGMLVKVAFEIDKKPQLMVPSSAIVHRSEVSAVYVADKKRGLHLRQIRTGQHARGKTEILSGLDAGETVALDPIRAGVYLKQQQKSSQTGAK